MITHYYSMFKTLTGVIVLTGAALYAVDPTIIVAAITAVAAVLSTLITLLFGLLIRRDNRELKINQEEMSHNVNGKLTKLLDERELKNTELTTTKENLAHAEGRLEATTIPVATPSDADKISDLLERVAKMENEKR